MPSARPVIPHPPRSPRHRTPDVTRKISRRRSLYDCSSSSDEFSGPAIRRVSCCTAGVVSSNPEMKMRAPISTMNRIDFDNLPPAVRRKYFSSLERLRYAQQQQHNCSSLPTSSHGRSLSSHSGKLNKSKTRSRPAYDGFRSTSSVPQTGNLNKPPSSAADEFILSQADAKWYLELPETIRRKHFSREERVLLAGKCETIIVDATDETIYRIGRQANRSLDTVNSLSSINSSSRASSLDLDAVNAVEEIRKSFRWMEEDGTLDLRLDEFYTHVARDPIKSQGKPSIQRTMSLSSKPYRAPSSHSSCTERPSFASRRPTSHSLGSSKQRSIHSADKDAAYYQDPEARLKLRVYLASPQKFDEAIEFGFPSTSDCKDFFNGRPRTSATIRQVEPELDSYSDDDSSISDFDDITISEAQDELLAFRKLRGSNEPLISTTIAPSRICGGAIFDPYLHSSPGNREMTLRMTLTRKDLRANENELYGWKKGNDPLALEELPPVGGSDAGQFDWGSAGKESGSGLKRLWRRVRGQR